MERVKQRLNRRGGLASQTIARSSFNPVDSIPKPITFIAPEEEHLVFYNRAADRTSKLIHSQRKFRFTIRAHAVEEVSGVEPVVTKELESRTVETVASGFRDDT